LHCTTALPFKFIDGLKDTDVLVSQEVTLACTVSKDDVQLTWKKNGNVLKPDGKKYEVVVEGAVHKLVIRDARPDDEAEYECCFGDQLTSCKLRVQGMAPHPSPAPFSIFLTVSGFFCYRTNRKIFVRTR